MNTQPISDFLERALDALRAELPSEALRLARLVVIRLENEYAHTQPEPRESWLTINEPEWTIASGHDTVADVQRRGVDGDTLYHGGAS